jgi:hypothetical protein
MLLFDSVIGNRNDSTHDHVFTLLTDGPDDVEVLTVQRGEASGRNEQVSDVQVNELGFAFSRSEIAVTGSAFGRATIFDGSGTDSDVDEYALHPVLPEDVCVYLDNSYATLGDTQLLRCTSASWTISNRFNPLWVLDCNEDSYVALVEATPDIAVELVVEADDVGAAAVDDFARAGVTAFIRIDADGGTIDTEAYQLTFDTSATMTGVGQLGDVDGVYALSLQFQGVVGDWGGDPGVASIDLKNGLAGE